MNPKRHLGLAVAAMMGLAALSTTGDVEAQGRGKAKAAAITAPAADPPLTKKPIVLSPSSLTWGLSIKQVTALVNSALDEAYKPLYKKVNPGVKMKALDAALAEEKATFARSRIDFGRLPTGVDASPLKGEYTYNNAESMMELTRDGQTRYFFFIGGKLWKVIDEIKLAEGNPLGATFQAAAVKLAETYGVPGRVLEKTPVEVDWKDASTHLRAIQRSDTALAFAYEDLATLANLSSLRTAKQGGDDEVDPAVAAAMRGPEPEKEAPKPKK